MLHSWTPTLEALFPRVEAATGLQREKTLVSVAKAQLDRVEVGAESTQSELLWLDLMRGRLDRQNAPWRIEHLAVAISIKSEHKKPE